MNKVLNPIGPVSKTLPVLMKKLTTLNEELDKGRWKLPFSKGFNDIFSYSEELVSSDDKIVAEQAPPTTQATPSPPENQNKPSGNPSPLKPPDLSKVLRAVLFERDVVEEAIKNAGFASPEEIEKLETIDDNIYRAGIEVSLRQNVNLAAWREYRKSHKARSESASDKKDDSEDSEELGWWWFLDSDQGSYLRSTHFIWLYIVRFGWGLILLVFFGYLTALALQDTFPAFIAYVDALLKNQNIAVLAGLNEATIAAVTFVVTQFLIVGRIALWGSQKVTELFNLGLLRHVRTKIPSWGRARFISIFWTSPLFSSIMVCFLIILVINSRLKPLLEGWTRTAQNASCLSLSDAQFVSEILQGEESLVVLARSGRCAQNVGLLDDARGTYRAILQRDPECLAALYFLGGLYFDEENTTLGLPLIDRGLSNIAAVVPYTSTPNPNATFTLTPTQTATATPTRMTRSLITSRTAATLDPNAPQISTVTATPTPTATATLMPTSTPNPTATRSPGACPMPTIEKEKMQYQYLFTLLLVRALLKQGFYNVALDRIEDLWHQVTVYDAQDKELFVHVETLDQDGQETGVISTAELSYYYALALEASIANTNQTTGSMRDEANRQWNYVITLTRDVGGYSMSRFLILRDDALCFTQTRTQSKQESTLCQKRKQELLPHLRVPS